MGERVAFKVPKKKKKLDDKLYIYKIYKMFCPSYIILRVQSLVGKW